jgi:hypothetical protein
MERTGRLEWIGAIVYGIRQVNGEAALLHQKLVLYQGVVSGLHIAVGSKGETEIRNLGTKTLLLAALHPSL